ncbi:alpha/beta-hydrolase [Schizopora paradoxa]|uniref:Alpha/beta-hydrolase n=1 Tax=Schizopora paradoxa TaxID=27342 RepID=A0A0H2R3B5_9AGAM|nr:alpha/beta-hydrolase [Schizopora paradoxa]
MAASASKRTTRIWIPHRGAKDVRIAGDLEQLVPEVPSSGRKLALILHGTMGHKDYLFQKKLAKTLPIDSFRFDFRGNHETGGTWKMADFPNDVEDIQVVADYLIQEYGYVIDLVIGHSKGSVAGFRWVCISPQAASVRGFVNVSGRYRMERVLFTLEIHAQIFDLDRNEPFKSVIVAQGHYDWKVIVARKEVVGRIHAKDVEDFMNWDTSLVWDRFPKNVHVMTIHGLNDATVPPLDAFIYARALGARSPGTHNLHMLEDADHNMTGRTEDVVSTILAWFAALEGGQLHHSGIWNTGVRVKL